MPLTPLNNDFLQCPICFSAFSIDRKPITLLCSHTCCCSCLSSLQNCPFDQTPINASLPENEAILSLILPHLHQSLDITSKLINTFGLNNEELICYRASVYCIKQLAQLLRPQNSGCVLSRPMQRKLVTLLHCQLVEPEGRLRAIKNARSIGERTLSELLLKHQDPYTLSANLWAAVRSRGCQFLGPAMQEEILKLVLLALEEGSHLSRKVLVMFVVQRLSPHFPHQASKTAIGHVIQLLYRASCFRLTKRDGDSSLMQLKEEYCSYEALRREHDTQIVSIALESGLKISPDQWSSLLYGDTQHKSHMQSIIDKLQSPQSFNQSIQELIIALQRTQDPAGLIQLREHFERLARIEQPQSNGSSAEPGAANATTTTITSTCGNSVEMTAQQMASTTPSYPSLQELSEILESCRLVTFRLIDFLRQHGNQVTLANGQQNGIVSGGPSRYNGRGSSGGVSTGSGGHGRYRSNRGQTKQAGFISAPIPNAQSIKPTFNGQITIQPEKTHSMSAIGNGVGGFKGPTASMTLSSPTMMNGVRAMRDPKHKPCAYVPPTVQPLQAAFTSKPAHPPKSNSPKHLLNGFKNNQQQSNGYSNNLGSHASNNNTQNGVPGHNHQSQQPQQNGLINGIKANGINNSLQSTNGIGNVNLFMNGQRLVNSNRSAQSTVSTLKQQQQQLLQSISQLHAQKQQQPLQHQQNIQQSFQNGHLVPQSSAKSIVNLLNGSTNNYHSTQKSSNLSSSTSSNLIAGSFEDDQFIPFADQPFVSKFGPISRSMNMLDTPTITDSTARFSNGVLTNGQSSTNDKLRDIWNSSFGNSESQTQLTNVMLGRQGMPSLTLIEPMQQLALSSNFVDQQFL